MISIDLAKLRDYAATLPQGALAPVRRDAIAMLEKTGLPTTRDEDFKYTDLSDIASISDRWLAERAESAPSPAAETRIASLSDIDDVDWIILRNGATEAAFDADIPGLEIRRLGAKDGGADVSTSVSALNLALLGDGIMVDVLATPERPVGLLLVDDAETAAGVSPTRIAIRVAEDVSLELIDYHASFGNEPHYSSTFLTLDVAANGSVRHARIQDRGLAHSQTHACTVTLGGNARFDSASFDFGGRLVRNDLRVELPAVGAHADFHGFYLAGEGQHVDNHTRVDHRVGPATSRQEYRGILAGQSRAVWNGKALVYDGADGTDAEQSNHNLLLSERAEIDTKPELEIYAEDVRCSHGTTVGQLDEKALFYLRTRGIAEDEARRLLVRAFAGQTLDSIPVAAIRDHLAELLDQRLQRLGSVVDSV